MGVLTAGTGKAAAFGLGTRVPRFLLYAAVFLLLLRLNRLTDFTADDFIYHFYYQAGTPNQGTRLLEHPLDIIGSMVVHYQVQNGRILPHVIIQFFMLFDKAVFDVANSLVFLLVGQLILRHVWRGRGFSVAHELAVYVALWLFIPYFGQSVLWLSGGVNYLWMTALTLLTLLPYRLHEPGRPRQPWMVPSMLLVGLAAGGANENSGGAWILMALLFMVKWRLTGARVVPGWAWAGVVGAATGLVVQVVSPGNQARAAKLGGGLTVENSPERLAYILRLAVETSGLLLVVFAATVFLARRNPLRERGALATASVYVAAGLVSGFVMVVTPTMPHRSWIWSVAFLLVAIGIAGRQLPTGRVRPLLLSGIIVVMLGWGSVEYVRAHASIEQTHREVERQLAVIADSKARGNLDVVVTKFRQPTNRYDALAYTGNLRDDPNASFNQWYARYYGIDSITIDNPQEMYR